VPGTDLSLRRWVVAGAIVFLGCSLVPTLSAETYFADRFDDDNGACTPGDCTLREAILAAEANPGPDTILVADGHHRLSIPPAGGGDPATGVLEILSHDVEIRAENWAIVDAQGIDRVFRFLHSTSTVANLEITGGIVESGVGGGLFIEESQMTLFNLSIHRNRAAIGGGLAVEQGVTTASSIAITNNESHLSGGGAFIIGISQFNVGRLELSNCTISGNAAGTAGAAIDRAAAGQLQIDYCTIVDNTNRPGDPTIFGFLGGLLSDARYSLVEGACMAGLDDTRCLYLSSKLEEVPVTDLGLEPLSTNVGYTPTHALTLDSPALDVVPAAAACPAADQRGVLRPIDADLDGDARCDAGAYERGPVTVLEVPALPPTGLGFLAVLLTLLGLSAIRRQSPQLGA
jgi:CSLREA domain-containing protein